MPPVDPKTPGVANDEIDEDLDVQDDGGEAEDDVLEADALQDDEAGDQDAGDEGEGEEGRGRVLDGKRRPDTRRNDDIRSARERAQAAEQRAIQVEAELAAMRAQFGQADEARRAEKEAAELELMSPDQRADYKIRKGEERMQRQMLAAEFRMHDQSDKLAFDALCRSDPRAKKLAPEVERRLTEMRAKGQNVSRENLLAFVIGRRALDNAAVTGKQRRQAERRRERETARGASPRGDAQGERRRAGKTPAERLDGVQI